MKPDGGAGGRWLARLAVLALHAALLALLLQHRAPPLAEPAQRRDVTLRLLPPERLAEAPPSRTPPAPPPAWPALPTRPLPPLQAPAEAPAAAPTAPADQALATPPATEPPRSGTLRLTLPPGYAASTAAARNPALSDPRSNTPKLTLEDRIADATGGAGAWVEEQTSENRTQAVGALGEYRAVMRRGNTCVEIFRSRISDTDPFNGNVAPRATKMIGKPYQCR